VNTFLCDREPDPDARFRVETTGRDANRTLLTARRDSITSAWRVAGGEEALRLGPGALDVLDEVPGADRLVWQGSAPTGGLHVDFDDKTLGFWWAHPSPAIMARTAAAWPAWEISWFEDRFEAQGERSGLDIGPPERPAVELLAGRIENLRRCCHWTARNPARDLAARIGAAKIGAATDDARGSVGEEAEKLKILDGLSRRMLGRHNWSLPRGSGGTSSPPSANLRRPARKRQNRRRRQVLRRGVFASHPRGHILTPPEPFGLQISRSGLPEGLPDRSTCWLPGPHDVGSENLASCRQMFGDIWAGHNRKMAVHCNFLWIIWC